MQGPISVAVWNTDTAASFQQKIKSDSLWGGGGLKSENNVNRLTFISDKVWRV